MPVKGRSIARIGIGLLAAGLRRNVSDSGVLLIPKLLSLNTLKLPSNRWADLFASGKKKVNDC